VAGCLVATFITFESPLSGMSMNPARTFASAAPSGIWSGFWIYLVAPLLAMLTSAQLYRRRVFCAKFHHHNNQRCIFRCNFGALDNE
jgi:aquaporin Z